MTVNDIMAILAALLLAASMAAEAQVYYKWRDDQGTVHFSAEPPIDRDYEAINTRGQVIGRSADGAPATDAAQAGQDEAAVQMPREAKVDPDLIRSRCQQARENLFWLQAKRRIIVERDDGTQEFIGPEEQQRQIQANRAFLEEWCGNVPG